MRSMRKKKDGLERFEGRRRLVDEKERMKGRKLRFGDREDIRIRDSPISKTTLVG